MKDDTRQQTKIDQYQNTVFKRQITIPMVPLISKQIMH